VTAPPGTHTTAFRRGVLLVAGAAVVWSFGGAIARFIGVGDSWSIVFWRSVFAAAFLLLFMLARDGLAGTIALLGKDGGTARGLADHALVVASADTAHIQAAHLFILHYICELVEAAVSGR